MKNITEFTDKEFEEKINKFKELLKDSKNPQSRFDAFDIYSEIMDNLKYEHKQILMKAMFGINQDDIDNFADIRDLNLGDSIELTIE